MRKRLVTLLLAAVFFPQTALAHFEANHEAFWYEPMHWLFQHHLIMTLIGVGLIGIAIYLKISSEKE